jgi:phosphate starvation-inducible PhoH-like protein
MRGQIQDIEPEQIHLAIKEARVLEQSAESVPEYGKAVNIKTKRGVIKPRTPNQAQYIANILDHDITFGVGPAGTGKPIWRLRRRSMRWSVRRSAVFC